MTVPAVAASWKTTFHGGGGRIGAPTKTYGRQNHVDVAAALPAGANLTTRRAVLVCERGLHRLWLRRLISQAIPEILATAHAIWSRQRAITAGRVGSITPA